MAVTFAETLAFELPVIVFPLLSEFTTTKISPKRWRCETGDHQWHTLNERAQLCAFRALSWTEG